MILEEADEESKRNITDDEKCCHPSAIPGVVLNSESGRPYETLGASPVTSQQSSNLYENREDELVGESEINRLLCLCHCKQRRGRIKPELINSMAIEDAHISSLDLAVCHIDDALHGRGSYGKAKTMGEGPLSKFCFAVLDNVWYGRFLYLIIMVYGIVVIWEPTQHDTHSNVQPDSAVMMAVLIIHALCLVIFISDVLLHIVYFSCSVFWTSAHTRWVRMEFVLTVMFLVDFLMLIVQYLMGQRLVAPFRCLRAMMIICKARNVQHVTAVCLSIVVKLGKVFLVILLFIAVFAAIGIHLFTESYHNIAENAVNISSSQPVVCNENSTQVYAGAFDHFGVAALQVFVLLTTENYPEIMMPAFNVTEWSFFYFGLFLYVGVFFLTAIVLAIIVDSYWEFAKKHVKEERKKEREQIIKAWNILDESGAGRLAIDDVKLYYVISRIKPKCNEEDLREMLDYIDEDGDGYIGTYEWTTRLADILNYQISDTQSNKRCCEWERKSIRRVTESGVFTRVMLIILVIYCILFCIKWCGMSDLQTLIIHSLKTAVSFLCLIEAMVRVISSSRVFETAVDLVDIILTVIAVISSLLWYIHIPDAPIYRSVLSVLAGVAMMIKVGLNSRRIREAVSMFFKIAPVMLDLMSLVLVIMYFYAVIGWEVFYNKEFPTNSTPNFYNCGLGFQSFKCSFFMVFQIVSTSNWHELMNAARVHTGTDWTAIYFVSCYVMIVLIFMNLFVAIAIEAFNKLAVKEEVMEGGQPRQKRSMSVAQSAKTFFSTILSSSREHGGEDIILSADIESDGKSETPQNVDLSSMSSEQKKQYVLKQRRTKRKRQQIRIRVVMAYRKKNPGEIDLHVGDEVKVLQKKAKLWRGETTRGKIGWFPADCVQEVLKGSQRLRRQTTELPLISDLEEPDQPETEITTKTQTKDEVVPRLQAIVHMATGRSGEESTTQNNAAPNRNRSRAKIASQSTGDWRRKILGNMTVMNHEEMMELNKIMKADRAARNSQTSTPHQLSARGSQTSTPQAVAEQERDTETEEYTGAVPATPQILIQPITEQNEDEELISEVFEDDVKLVGKNNQLTVSPTHKPPPVKKNKGGKESGMPDWARLFLQKKQLNIDSTQQAD